MAKSTKNSQEEKIDLRSVNNAPRKSFKLPTLKNPFKKQSDPLRDDEGKFATKATIGSGGLHKISKFNLKRAFPLLIVVTIVGGSLVYQSFAAACSITADKTTLYKGESTTIHWSSSAKPIAIGTTGYGHGTEAGALTRWSSGALYSNTTFYLTGGWDSSCKDSVTITVRERPAETPDQPAPTTTGPGTSSGPSAANIEIAKKWYQSCGGLGRQSEWEHWAAKIGSDRQAAWRQFKGAMETSPDRKCPVDDPTITTGGDAGKTTDYAKEAQNYATLSDAFLKQAKELNGETYKRSLISNPERKDLDFIANKEIYLRRSITSLQMGLQLSQNWYNQAMANPSTKSQGPSIQASMATVTRNISAIGVYVTNIANDYARLKPKYEAGLAWYQWGERQALERQKCTKDGGSLTWGGRCVKPKQSPLLGGLGGTKGDSNSGSGSSSTSDTRPKFATPIEKCSNSYIPVSGKMLVEWKWGGPGVYQTSRIDAVTCLTPSPARDQGYDYSKAYQVCPSGYTARHMNKTFYTASRSPLPTGGWICFRGEADWLRR